MAMKYLRSLKFFEFFSVLPFFPFFFFLGKSRVPLSDKTFLWTRAFFHVIDYIDYILSRFLRLRHADGSWFSSRESSRSLVLSMIHLYTTLEACTREEVGYRRETVPIVGPIVSISNSETIQNF